MIRSLFSALLDIWLPRACHGCGLPLTVDSERSLCDTCLASVEYVCSPSCIRCGAGLSRDAGDRDRLCAQCLQHPPPFDSARSVLFYREPASSLLLRLKFQADTRATAPISELIDQAPPTCFTSYDHVMPVPLHPARLRSRGLNQALILARLMFADERSKIAATGLIRLRNTVPQTSLSGRSRRKNLRGVFATNPRTDVADKDVCVVDDVFTTGTTVSECAKTLKRAGARRVDVWTFARA